MATMPLLTPFESYAFQSFLETIDYADGVAAPEWSMYTNGMHDEYEDEALPPRREGTEQLTRATKDLMALDTNPLRWNHSADRDLPGIDTDINLGHRPLASRQLGASAHTLPISKYTTLPPLNAMPPVQSHRPPLTVVPSRTIDSSSASVSRQSASSVSSDPSPSPPTPPTHKRPYPSSSLLSLQAGPSSGPGFDASQPPHKRHRPSPPHQTGPILNSRPTLLTPSQKKANHIQSEQKRRANIRRGYEALCETVPALREAIRAEEEAQAAAESTAKGKSKKKGRGKKAVNEPGEKIDGRAGPKSENVVLQKTIDHITGLLSDRASLLERLNRAKCMLAPGHPAMTPSSKGVLPLWEREWTGGQGLLDDGDGDSDGDEDS